MLKILKSSLPKKGLIFIRIWTFTAGWRPKKMDQRGKIVVTSDRGRPWDAGESLAEKKQTGEEEHETKGRRR
jgi:hypothetical protein